MRVAAANDELLRQTKSYRAVGVTEIVLIVAGQNALGLADEVAGALPRLRAVG